MREARTNSRPALVRPVPVKPAGWWPDAIALAGFIALTVALALRAPALLGLDTAVADWCDAHRPVAAYWVARGLNLLGQGTPLALAALAVAALLAWRTRSARPIALVVAAFVLTYLTIGPLKLWTNRAAPHASIDHPEWLFHDAGGRSYPSGHVVNAIVWYGVLVLVLGAVLGSALQPGWRRALRVAPPLIVLGTTTYLGFHWVTDGLAALLLGLVLDRLIHRVPWDEVPLGRRLAARRWDGPAGLGQPGLGQAGLGQARRR